MRTTIPFLLENVVTNALSMVSSMLGRAAFALALCLTTSPVIAADLVPDAAEASLDMSPDMDSAKLADLPLETLMRVAVSPSASMPVLAPILSEVYALRYVAPGVDQGVPQEAMSQARVALFTGRLGGF